MHRDGWARSHAAPALLLFSFLVSVPAEAADFSVIPSISLDGVWDSNVFDSSTDETSDYIFRARPALALRLGVFETTAEISGGFEFERYADNSQLDETTATNNLNLEVAQPFRITPNFFLKPTATYVETVDSVRRIELTQDPAQELPPAETVVTERSKQRIYRAGLQMTYLVTPRVDFSLGGGGTVRDFVEPVPGTEEEDSRTITGDTTVLYRFTPRFSSGLFFSASRHSFDLSPSSRGYSGGWSSNYLLTPNHNLSWRVGATYFEEDADATGDQSEEWSPYGSLTLAYDWRNFRAIFGGSYQTSGAGSFGQATKRGTVNLILRNQFAERWWWDLAAAYQTNRSFEDQETVDIATAYGSAGIRYTATEWASLRLSGNVIRQRSDGPEGDDVDQESVILGVQLRKPFQFGKLY